MLYKMLDDMLALANSVFVLGLPRSNRHVHGLLLCARLVLCCALLAVLLLYMLEDNMLVHTGGLIVVLCCTGLACVSCRTYNSIRMMR